jgi:hypothetical protein
MAKFTVVVNKIERAVGHSSVTVTMTPVPERGVMAARPVSRIFMIEGQITLAGLRAEVDIVGASFEVDV